MPNWPNKYSIVGTRTQLEALSDVGDLYILDHGRHPEGDDSFSVIVYATPAAAADATARGCTVTLLATGDQQEQVANDEIAGRTGPDGLGVG